MNRRILLFCSFLVFCLLIVSCATTAYSTISVEEYDYSSTDFSKVVKKGRIYYDQSKIMGKNDISLSKESTIDIGFGFLMFDAKRNKETTYGIYVNNNYYAVDFDYYIDEQGKFSQPRMSIITKLYNTEIKIKFDEICHVVGRSVDLNGLGVKISNDTDYWETLLQPRLQSYKFTSFEIDSKRYSIILAKSKEDNNNDESVVLLRQLKSANQDFLIVDENNNVYAGFNRNSYFILKSDFADTEIFIPVIGVYLSLFNLI